MTLARRLVEMHSGSIQALSEGVGRGSEFVVRLPLSSQSRLERRPPMDSAQPRGATRRILLVEDNEQVLQPFAELLTALGHEVETAMSGADALQVISAFSPEVAFVDIGLPDMDGYELAGELRQRLQRETPYLVALTGYRKADVAARHSGLSPFDEYILKPLSLNHLKDILANVGDA